MIRIQLGLVLFILSTMCFAQPGAGHLQVDLAKASAQAERIAEQVFKKEAFPGLAVVVHQDNMELWSKTFGYADKASLREIDLGRSLFRIGSVSKPYTTTALALLFQQGEILLDVPIQTYVPYFPKKSYEVTLRQLAGHLGGIRHYKGDEFMSDVHYPTVREGLAIFQDDPLIHEPGTKYAYSSYGWNLISAAIEGASGQDFLSYMQEEVFSPLSMSHTIAEDVNAPHPDLVTFYERKGDDIVVAPRVDNSYKWAGGGFVSSPRDVIKFGRSYLEGSLLSDEIISLWTSPQVLKDGQRTNYGLGWTTGEDKKGRRWFGHSGGSVGGTTMLLIFPKEQLIIVTVVNQSSARMNDLAFRIAEQFLSNQ